MISQEDYDMICGENKSMAEFLSTLGYSQEEISNIADGSYHQYTVNTGRLNLYQDEMGTNDWISVCDVVKADSSQEEIEIHFIRSK